MTPPQRSGAAARSSKPSGTRRATSARTTIRSANPPSRSHAVKRGRRAEVLPAGPAGARRSRTSRPASRRPRGRRPTSPSTPRPTASTRPTTWWPGIVGRRWAREVALDELEVGPAHGAGGDAQEQLARAGLGVRHVPQVGAARPRPAGRALQDERAHHEPPTVRRPQRTETLPMPPRTSISTRLAALAKSGDSQASPAGVRGKRDRSTSLEPSAIEERIRAATPSGTRKPDRGRASLGVDPRVPGGARQDHPRLAGARAQAQLREAQVGEVELGVGRARLDPQAKGHLGGHADRPRVRRAVPGPARRRRRRRQPDAAGARLLAPSRRRRTSPSTSRPGAAAPTAGGRPRTSPSPRRPPRPRAGSRGAPGPGRPSRSRPRRARPPRGRARRGGRRTDAATGPG